MGTITMTLKVAMRDLLQSPDCAANCLRHVGSSSAAFPSYISGFTILGEIFACVTLFDSTIQVVTFRPTNMLVYLRDGSAQTI